MVTIGLPVYHAERWVGEAIESVLGQTYGEWEMIVTIDEEVEDGVEWVEEVENDERIRVIRDGRHKGISARLNEMVQMARGEFFARMDADDVMMPERLEKQVRYLLEHPEVDVVSSSAVVVEASLVERELKGVEVRRKGIIHPTVMGRTQWFRKHPYRTECDGCEDWDLWLRSKKDTTFGFIPEPLLYYRTSKEFDKEKYLQRRRQGRVAIRMNRDILPWWKYYYLLADSYLKSIITIIIK